MKGSKGFKRTRNILLSALAVATLLTGSALPAFAEGTDTTTTTTTTGTLSINKTYNLTLPSGEDATKYASPSETFTFSSGESGATSTTPGKASLAALKGTSWNTNMDDVQEISGLGTDVTNAANIPQTVSISSSTFASGAATADGTPQAVNVNLDGTYTKPGVYYYDFHEEAGTTAGVTYDSNNYRVAVTIENNNGTLTASQVKLINKATGKKADSVDNIYGAGKLSFTKKVAGNMGDTSKQFKVTVTLTAPTGKTVNSTIGVAGKGTTVAREIASIAPDAWTKGVATKTFTVQDGTTISLTNIPEGVSCLVKEDDYSAAGYKTTYSLNGATTGNADTSTAPNMVAGGNDVITITNTNDTTIDTGIFTSNLPYILILAVAVAGAAAFVVISRKHRA